MSGRHRALRIRLSPRARLAGIGALAVGLIAAALLAPSAPAAATITDDVTITGHGYGHGRGLSQWGSYGWATQYGSTYQQILALYYSNAILGNIGETEATVRLVALDGTSPEVWSGLPFTAGGGPVQPGQTAQITRNGDGSWTVTVRQGCGGTPTYTGPLQQPSSPEFRTQADPGNDVTKMLNVCSTGRAYRGWLQMAWDGSTHVVNHVWMQDYLRGVVPRESPASWGDAANGAGINALRAQAVAARAYAQSENRYSYAKTCDTTSCQVYGGAGLNGARIEDARTDQAVADTAGQVMLLNGQVARTEFSSSSGGWTAGGTFPAVQDDGDLVAANPNRNWSVTKSPSAISSAFGVGDLQDIVILSRNGLGSEGGRVTKVRVVGSTRSVDVTGDQFRSSLGLKSDWFSVEFENWDHITGTPTTVDDASTGNIPDLSPVQVSAVVAGNGATTLFVRGTDNSIWYRTGSGTNYGGWQEIRGTVATSGPAAVTWNGSQVDVVVRGGDGAYWRNIGWFDGSGRPGSWGGWVSLGGRFTTAPGIASVGAGKMAIVGRGGDGVIYQLVWGGSFWSGWASLGGQAGSAAAIAADPAHNRYVVSTIGSDGLLWQAATGTVQAGTGGWVGTSYRSTLGPQSSATSWRAASPSLLTLGGPSHNAVVVRADGSRQPLGGGMTSMIAIAPQSDGSFLLYGRGGDNAVWMVRYADGKGGNWVSLGGAVQ